MPPLPLVVIRAKLEPRGTKTTGLLLQVAGTVSPCEKPEGAGRGETVILDHVAHFPTTLRTRTGPISPEILHTRHGVALAEGVYSRK